MYQKHLQHILAPNFSRNNMDVYLVVVQDARGAALCLFAHIPTQRAIGEVQEVHISRLDECGLPFGAATQMFCSSANQQCSLYNTEERVHCLVAVAAFSTMLDENNARDCRLSLPGHCSFRKLNGAAAAGEMSHCRLDTLSVASGGPRIQVSLQTRSVISQLSKYCKSHICTLAMDRTWSLPSTSSYTPRHSRRSFIIPRPQSAPPVNTTVLTLPPLADYKNRKEAEGFLRDVQSWGRSIVARHNRPRQISERFKNQIEKIMEEAGIILRKGMKSKAHHSLMRGLQIELDAVRSRTEADIEAGQILHEVEMAYKDLEMCLRHGDYWQISLDHVVECMEEGVREVLFPKFWSETWESIDRRYAEELAAKHAYDDEQERQPNLAHSPPPAPLCQALRSAASTAGIELAQLQWEIHGYATRNRHAHNGIGMLIKNGQFGELAYRITIDRRTVLKDWASNPNIHKNDVKRAAASLDKIQKMFFTSVKEYDNDTVTWMPTEGTQKQYHITMQRRNIKPDVLGDGPHVHQKRY